MFILFNVGQCTLIDMHTSCNLSSHGRLKVKETGLGTWTESQRHIKNGNMYNQYLCSS